MQYHQLAQEERHLISAGSALRRGVREVARQLNRSPIAVSRQLRRNATASDDRDRAEKANSCAIARRRRARRGSHFSRPILAEVDRAPGRHWSPGQVVGAFKAQGRIVPSHEAIHRRIRRDKRRGDTLYRHTRIMSKIGRKRYRIRPARGVLLGKRHISERPAIVGSRKQFGHWEADTVMGHGSAHCLSTLVERKSGYTAVRKLNDRNKAEATAAQLAKDPWAPAIASHPKR